MKNIFNKLNEMDLCYSVIAIGSVARENSHGIIIHGSDISKVEGLEFYEDEDGNDIYHYDLNLNDVSLFNRSRSKFTLVSECDYGKVYELNGNSLKDKIDAYNEKMEAIDTNAIDIVGNYMGFKSNKK